MKKTLFFAAAAICAAALAVSCEKNGIEVNVAPEGESHVFTCVLPDNVPESKYSISEAGKVSWEVGDEIMIHGGKDGSARLLVTLTANDIISEKQAKIDLGTFEPYVHSDSGDDWGYYAQYPANLVPEGSMYYECCFQGTDAPLMAACSIDNTFSFKNLCGIISYTVSGDFNKVVFAGNNKETVAFDYYQVRVRKDLDKVNYHKPGNGFKTYTELKTIEKAVVADGSTINYLYLPMGVNFSSGFTFKFYNSNDECVKVATSETAVNVDHDKLLALGNISSKLEDYVAPQTSDHKSAITGASSLADKQANCYVISEAGAYKFPALKGNSDEPAGEVFDVALLWESYNNAEEVAANSVIAAVDFEDNWIYFQTPETLKPGNALIAAKDVDGKIIWSWHIWIPASTIDNIENGIHTVAMMDRNLGALVVTTPVTGDGEFIDVTSIGLVYQWGRKDPFLGPDKIKEGDYRSWATYAGEATFTSEKCVLSLKESIQKPTLYAAGTDTNHNWLSPYDKELWGDSGDKAIYDPCPAGYRVPKRASDCSLWSDSDITAATGWSCDNVHLWFTLGSPVTVFPCAGYRNGGDWSFKTTFRTIIWNSHLSSYQGTNDEPYYSAYNRRLEWSSGAPKVRNDSQYNYIGGAVRCCVE